MVTRSIHLESILRMSKPTCPLCNRRRARRSCPALGKQICAVCCGTKRQVEITCPSDCSYLQSSTVHPPAVIQRRQERDLRFLLPTLQGLTESQHQILFMVQSFLRIDHQVSPGNDSQRKSVILLKQNAPKAHGYQTSTSPSRCADWKRPHKTLKPLLVIMTTQTASQTLITSHYCVASSKTLVLKALLKRRTPPGRQHQG